jgi:hypothetical protein
MWTTTIGDANYIEYRIEVKADGFASVDELVAGKTTCIFASATVQPTATFFPSAVGERICNAINEGREVLGHKRS